MLFWGLRRFPVEWWSAQPVSGGGRRGGVGITTWICSSKWKHQLFRNFPVIFLVAGRRPSGFSVPQAASPRFSGIFFTDQSVIGAQCRFSTLPFPLEIYRRNQKKRFHFSNPSMGLSRSRGQCRHRELNSHLFREGWKLCIHPSHPSPAPILAETTPNAPENPPDPGQISSDFSTVVRKTGLDRTAKKSGTEIA